MATYENTSVEKLAAPAPDISGSRPELSSSTRSPLPAEPVVVNDAIDPTPIFDFHDLWTYRELLYFLTWRDIKVRYKQTAMGAAWAIIQPLFTMFVFAIFFGFLIRVPTDGMPYLAFFYCGLLPWTFFSNAITQSSQSLVVNSNLITKVYFPRVIIPTATITGGFVDLLIASLILAGLAFYYRLGISWNLLMLPLLVILTVLFSLALGIFVAALTAKYRDVRHALPFVLQLWMFLTPIIYPLSIVPAKWQWVVSLNPMTGIVEGIRSSLIGRPFEWKAIAISCVVTLIIMLAGASVFRRIERSLADLI